MTVFQRYNHGENNHYQDEHAISVYLWLRYPDKYYIYQFGIIKNVAERLNTGLVFKKGAYKQNMAQFYPLYDELNGLIKSDVELATLLGKHISGKNRYYPDLELKTLTVDVGHYIGRYLEEKDFVKVESVQDENPSVDQPYDDIQEVSDDSPRNYWWLVENQAFGACMIWLLMKCKVIHCIMAMVINVVSLRTF